MKFCSYKIHLFNTSTIQHSSSFFSDMKFVTTIKKIFNFVFQIPSLFLIHHIPANNRIKHFGVQNVIIR